MRIWIRLLVCFDFGIEFKGCEGVWFFMISFKVDKLYKIVFLVLIN